MERKKEKEDRKKGQKKKEIFKLDIFSQSEDWCNFDPFHFENLLLIPNIFFPRLYFRIPSKVRNCKGFFFNVVLVINF